MSSSAATSNTERHLPTTNADGGPPTLADGVELIGEYKGSGFEDPPYLARRTDGQIVQMKRLLYLVAEEIDGRRDIEHIAESATDRYGVKLRPDQAQVLVERLRGLGVVAADGEHAQHAPPVDPLIALKLRAAIIPPRAVDALSRFFAPVFKPAVVVLVLAALAALDVWLFGMHGVAQAVRQTLYHPALLLLTLGLLVLGTAFHECGHAAACRYGGAKPGKIGMGIFVVWPAFYTDVTDAYRLDRAGRLRTDLGGVYFNAIFALLIGGAYFATGYEPILLLIPIQHAEILHQLLPFIRLDGYYVISDLAGVPDMASRIKPTLTSMLPWRRRQGLVEELKPWVRAVVRVYVLTLTPVIVLFLGLLVLNLPRMFATAWDSGRLEASTIGHAVARGDLVTVIVTLIQLALLVIVPLGTVITLAQLGRRIAFGTWRVTDGRPAARAGVVAVALGAAAFAAFSLWPSPAYLPIQPGERGTLSGALAQLARLPHGRTAVTPEHARQVDHTLPTGGAQGGSSVPGSQPQDSQPRGKQPSPSTATTTPARSGTQPAPRGAIPNTPPRGGAPGTPAPGGGGTDTPASSPVAPPGAGPTVTASTPSATVSTPVVTATVPSVHTTPSLPVPSLPTPTVSTPVPLPAPPPTPTVSTPVPLPAPPPTPTVSTPLPLPAPPPTPTVSTPVPLPAPPPTVTTPVPPPPTVTTPVPVAPPPLP